VLTGGEVDLSAAPPVRYVPAPPCCRLSSRRVGDRSRFSRTGFESSTAQDHPTADTRRISRSESSRAVRVRLRPPKPTDLGDSQIVRIQPGRDRNQTRSRTCNNAVSGAERAQRQEFSVYDGRQNRRRRTGSAGNELCESVQPLPHSAIRPWPSQLIRVLDEVCRGQQVQPGQSLQRGALPRRLHEGKTVAVQSLSHAQSTRENRITGHALGRQFGGATGQRCGSSRSANRGFGGSGGPTATVGLVPMNLTQSVARMIGGGAYAWKIDEGLQGVRHDQRRYPCSPSADLPTYLLRQLPSVMDPPGIASSNLRV